jgi:KaiC/GvpD/RAD55 family RecA-like ATPase
MESDNLGKRLVRSLLNTGEFDPGKYGVSLSDLSNDAFEAANFIISFKNEYGSLPTEDQIAENVSIEFTKEPENPQYVADLILKRKAEFELEYDLKRAARLLRDEGPGEADKFLKSLLGKEYLKSKHSEHLEFFVSGWEERYERYLKNKKQPVKGIPFPWETLNKACMGLLPGEMSVFVAPSGTGKSWTSCIVASNSLRLGHKVMLVTMEMSSSRIAGRVDCVHYGLAYSDVRQNDIEVFNEIRWKSSLEEEKKGEILILDNTNIQYVEDILKYQASFKPDVIIIDGGYILKSRINGNNWEQSADVIKALQEHCQKTKIPWMVTTQQNLPDKKIMTSQQKASTVRYGKEWWLVSDVMVELSQNQDQRDFLREVSFNILKIREADGSDIKTEFKAEWDFDMARFGELPEDFEYDLEVEY